MGIFESSDTPHKQSAIKTACVGTHQHSLQKAVFGSNSPFDNNRETIEDIMIDLNI